MGNSIEQEVDKLAQELSESVKKTQEAVSKLDGTKRGDRLPTGFSFIEQYAKEYAFSRFYALADKSKLKQETVELYNKMKDAVEQAAKTVLDNKEEIPQELVDFLNK